MSALMLAGAGYRYPTGRTPAVADVYAAVNAGELLLITGPTGCGKSTLLRLAAGLLQRHGSGTKTGIVRLGGQDPATLESAARVGVVGFVSQNPDRQIVAGTTGDEIALGIESTGRTEGLEDRVAELLGLFGLPLDPERKPTALSGGQRQRLVVASALAGAPPLLLLDEPLAQLDPRAADELMTRLRGLADDGVAVVVVEHRLEATWDRADRVLVLNEGKPVALGHPDELDLPALRELGLKLPALLDLRDRVARKGLDLRNASWAVPEVAEERPGAELLAAGPLTVAYDGVVALDGVEITLSAGERVALVGANGSGKSTLLKALAGELDGGEVACPGRIVDVPQDPDLALFCATAREEIAYGPTEARRADTEPLVARLAAQFSVTPLLGRPPQALSRGQRLRVAVAAALAVEPAVLLLDEPTSGQDRDQVERLMLALRSPARGLLFATHDLDLALRHATRIVWLDEGRIAYDGEPDGLLDVLPPDGALAVPDLAVWCRQRSLPLMTPAQLAELVE